MKRTIKTFIIITAITVLCSCGGKETGGTPPIANDKKDFYSQSQNDNDFYNQSQDGAEEENASEELTMWEILHNFNWMGDDGNYENAFADKPFLQINADGNSGAVGVCDINRDGEMEFLMVVYHVPRGIPSTEVFTIQDNRLQSIGGFFGRQDEPQKLSYYKDKQGRLLFLRETEAHYGGITNTLVATYLDDFCNVPVASVRSHYDSEVDPQYYYVFPDNSNIKCTNDFLCGGFISSLDSEDKYDATEEEYSARISEFMGSLTWVEDVEYDYSAYYHLYNFCELTNEIRGKEISEGLNASPPKDFHTPEEVKKTSDMVAAALYEAYYIDVLG